MQLGSFSRHRGSTGRFSPDRRLRQQRYHPLEGSWKRCPPTPQEGEVVVFVDHLARGFKPPGSKFYRDVLADFQLHPQDTGPNSVTNMCHFQVLCEAFFQEEPTVELFRDLFHLNRRTEFTDGSNTELGGVAIQKRKEVTYPHAKLHSHPKEWNQTWF